MSSVEEINKNNFGGVLSERSVEAYCRPGSSVETVAVQVEV